MPVNRSYPRFALLSVFFLLAVVIHSSAQCLCASITYQLKLADTTGGDARRNYSIKMGRGIYGGGLEIVPLDFKETPKGSGIWSFHFRTGGGIRELVFTITNLRTGEEMTVTTINISYDVPYHIDLLEFKKGSYSFNWSELGPCLKDTDTRIMNCNGKKFTHVYTGKNSYHPFSVRPLRLKDFEVRK